MLFVVLGCSVGVGSAEKHPPLSWAKCTKSGCTSQSGSVVIDQEWREVVDSTGKSCLKSNGDWDEAVCSGTTDCASKCYLNGFDYSKASVSTNGDTLKMGFVNPDGSVGSRLYLFDETAGQYVNFPMVNHEIAFDIDLSTLGCGTNSAVYFAEMLLDGGKSKYPENKAGAAYGTGYCDAQCPRDAKFIGNVANFGKPYGSCCYEFDLWEANKEATQLAAHSCSCKEGSYLCQSDCGSSTCDSSGCHANPYRDPGTGTITGFYGPGKTVDTTKKFTVVTQFYASGGDSGSLTGVKQKYVQGGKVFNFPDMTQREGSTTVLYDAINDTYCSSNLGAGSQYTKGGGDSGWTASFKRSAVLIFSLWTDGSMSWLDEGNAGPCTSPGGKDAVIAANKNSYMEVSNIRYGEIDTTY